MRNIIELQTKIMSLTRELSEVEVALHLAQQEEIGVHIGDMVKNKKGELVRVEGIDFSSYRKKPWIKGRRQKKNGEWAINQNLIFDDWEKV